MSKISVNTFSSEWTDTGAVVTVEGFSGVELHCPACDAVLPRGVEHRCGDRVKKLPRKRVKCVHVNQLERKS